MDISIEGFKERIKDASYLDSLLKTFGKKNEIKNYINENILLINEVYEMGLKLPIDERTKDIHRQVFIKIASEQVKGSPEELINYAKKLEQVYGEW